MKLEIAKTTLDPEVDPGTGLYTRRALEHSFGMRVHVGDVLHSVVYMDIDRLQVINQAYGFGGGDDVIRQVADLLTQPWLPMDALSARICGDQFAMVLRDCPIDVAREFSRRLQAEAACIAVGSPPRTVGVSLSFGIAMIRHGASCGATATSLQPACCARRSMPTIFSCTRNRLSRSWIRL